MTSFLPDLARENLSFYTIPVAWLIAVSPRFYGVFLYQQKTSKKFDPRAPRDFIGTVQASPALDTATKKRIQRAEAAQANGFENLGLFTAAVVAGNLGHLSPWTLNASALGYLASRLAFNAVYIANDTVPLAMLRSATFFVSLGLIMSLFVQAGNALRNTVL